MDVEKINFNVTVRLERLDEKFVKSATTCDNETKQLIDQNLTQNNRSNSLETVKNHCQQFNAFEDVPLIGVKRSYSPAVEK